MLRSTTLRTVKTQLSKHGNLMNNLSTKRASPSSFGAKLKIYSELSKFRLSSLVVLTTSAGFICAGGPVDICTMIAASTGTFLCAASAGTFNQIAEKEIDAKMKRTLQRPLPAGKVSPLNAAAFGGLTGLAGVSLLYGTTNPLVAALGLGNILLYAGPYTFSKRTTELNTWIGSIVGAIPPLMGWFAATQNPAVAQSVMAMASKDPLFFPSLMQEYGVVLTGEPLALAALLFLWQFPHFFALSYLYREDYSRGGFQMVACNDPVGSRSARLVMEYSLYLTAFPILTSALGYTSYMYSVEGTAANLYLLYLAKKFHEDRSNYNARKVFLCSLWYLPLLLAGFVFHSRVWNTITEDNENQVALLLTEGGQPLDQLSDALVSAKGQMKGLCLHEYLTQQEHFCVKLTADKMVDKAGQVAVAIEENVSGEPQLLLQSVRLQEDGKEER